MSTFLRILKYTPSVVLGLLVVAWVVSFNHRISYELDGYRSADIYYGSIAWQSNAVGPTVARGFTIVEGKCIYGRRPHPAGTLSSIENESVFALSAPVMLTVTALLLFAIGPFISFRFRLWHYLAYTALVALQLAYYLRWQA